MRRAFRAAFKAGANRAHGLKDHRLGEMAGQHDPVPDREGLYACHEGTVLAVKQ